MKTKMKQKEIACIICGLFLVITIMDYRLGLLYLGEPFICPAITYMVADEYYSAINVPYHYIGCEMVDQERTAFYYYNEPWAFVIDNREDFETVYAEYGMDETYVEGFDYTENILVLSINYPINQIYALERKVTWQGGIPYISPEFSYQNKMEKGMIYYYEVPRTEVQYEREDEVYTTNLHLSNPVYSQKKREHINFFPFFNKWGWAFDKFNYGR